MHRGAFFLLFSIVGSAGCASRHPPPKAFWSRAEVVDTLEVWKPNTSAPTAAPTEPPPLPVRAALEDVPEPPRLQTGGCERPFPSVGTRFVQWTIRTADLTSAQGAQFLYDVGVAAGAGASAEYKPEHREGLFLRVDESRGNDLRRASAARTVDGVPIHPFVAGEKPPESEYDARDWHVANATRVFGLARDTTTVGRAVSELLAAELPSEVRPTLASITPPVVRMEAWGHARVYTIRVTARTKLRLAGEVVLRDADGALVEIHLAGTDRWVFGSRSAEVKTTLAITRPCFAARARPADAHLVSPW